MWRICKTTDLTDVYLDWSIWCVTYTDYWLCLESHSFFSSEREDLDKVLFSTRSVLSPLCISESMIMQSLPLLSPKLSWFLFWKKLVKFIHQIPHPHMHLHPLPCQIESVRYRFCAFLVQGAPAHANQYLLFPLGLLHGFHSFHAAWPRGDTCFWYLAYRHCASKVFYSFSLFCCFLLALFSCANPSFDHLTSHSLLRLSFPTDLNPSYGRLFKSNSRLIFNLLTWERFCVVRKESVIDVLFIFISCFHLVRSCWPQLFWSRE